MPQVEGGPKGLNEILHSTYFSALSQNKDKGRASRIAWAAAKNKYKKHGENWVEKMYEDLAVLVVALDKVVGKAEAADYEYLTYPLQKLGEGLPANAVEYLPIDEFFANPYHDPADRRVIDEKKANITHYKAVKPLLYSEIDNNGKIEKIIVDGYHRFQALKELGCTNIPVQRVDDKGIRVSDSLKPAPLDLPVAKSDVVGLELVREDLQGAPKRGTHKLPEATTVTKGGPGSGRHPEDPISHADNLDEQIRRHKEDFKQGKTDLKTFKERIEPVYALKQRTGHFSGQTVKPVPTPVEKGGPGSGCQGPNCGRPTTGTTEEGEPKTGLSFLHGLRPAIKVGNQVHSGNLYETHADIYNRLIDDTSGYKQPDLEERDDIDTGFVDAKGNWMDRKTLYDKMKVGSSERLAELQHQAEKALKFIKADLAKRREDRLQKGGMGSGCQGPNCGRPSSGNKTFEEPFHSGNHIQQFLGSQNVVIGSVDKGHLSPEKNQLRQKMFESYLQEKKIPYKKGQGVSKDWGNETSYIMHAPSKDSAQSLHNVLVGKYDQDAVIHVRHGHAVMSFEGGTSDPVKHANINGGLEAGDHLTDNYTHVDGQKFRINFK